MMNSRRVWLCGGVLGNGFGWPSSSSFRRICSEMAGILPEQDAARSAGAKSLTALALLGAGISGLVSAASLASAGDEARHNGQNYGFVLLTGYRDPPAGVMIREGLHYNPYFPGGTIAMPKMLIDGAVEHEYGTPATESQMGKDAVIFLAWSAEPEMKERKLMGFKWIFVPSLASFLAAYCRRLRWSVLKSPKLIVDVVN